MSKGHSTQREEQDQKLGDLKIMANVPEGKAMFYSASLYVGLVQRRWQDLKRGFDYEGHSVPYYRL